MGKGKKNTQTPSSKGSTPRKNPSQDGDNRSPQSSSKKHMPTNLSELPPIDTQLKAGTASSSSGDKHTRTASDDYNDVWHDALPPQSALTAQSGDRDTVWHSAPTSPLDLRPPPPTFDLEVELPSPFPLDDIQEEGPQASYPEVPSQPSGLETPKEGTSAVAWEPPFFPNAELPPGLNAESFVTTQSKLLDWLKKQQSKLDEAASQVPPNDSRFVALRKKLRTLRERQKDLVIHQTVLVDRMQKQKAPDPSNYDPNYVRDHMEIVNQQMQQLAFMHQLPEEIQAEIIGFDFQELGIPGQFASNNLQGLINKTETVQAMLQHQICPNNEESQLPGGEHQHQISAMPQLAEPMMTSQGVKMNLPNTAYTAHPDGGLHFGNPVMPHMYPPNPMLHQSPITDPQMAPQSYPFQVFLPMHPGSSSYMGAFPDPGNNASIYPAAMHEPQATIPGPLNMGTARPTAVQVSNLPLHFSQQDLRQVFETKDVYNQSNVLDAKVMRNPNNRPNGKVVVLFRSRADAQDTVARFAGMRWPHADIAYHNMNLKLEVRVLPGTPGVQLPWE